MGALAEAEYEFEAWPNPDLPRDFIEILHYLRECGKSSAAQDSDLSFNSRWKYREQQFIISHQGRIAERSQTNILNFINSLQRLVMPNCNESIPIP